MLTETRWVKVTTHMNNKFPDAKEVNRLTYECLTEPSEFVMTPSECPSRLGTIINKYIV